MSQPLLKVSNLKKHYIIRDRLFAKRRVLAAVDNVSFAVGRRETLGIVGESGCGKSTLARCLVSLEKTTSGQIQFDGVELTAASQEELRQLRRNLQIVFQDPYAALNPLRTVGESIIEPLLNYNPGDSRELEEKVEQLLTVVGLNPEYKTRYPYQFSGGQLQRVNIARALALNPALVVCDEAVSNLDSIVKMQIVDLLLRLQDEFNMSYIFITHDLHVVRRIADRMAVMLGGKIVEVLPAGELAAAIHPYTRYLLSSTLSGNPRRRRQRKQGTQLTGPAGNGQCCRVRLRAATPVSGVL
ncbi:dipeptide transporter; ATP-binding component of ABC superfamily [uncultured Sporomusa sp.]|uniref:Dipeptide transporter ATP-binding component of ABC superfamily n=1 Tax=uncultured Sporomusa sp. TaxID=307249 RepID=A0A212M095_9FIRM|nr:ATP-binding cassette domain-containing protein [uncultured Sporomusa sp.]SCM83208.1 dipeptide transporter; ATP-binding component of ABC superfamily [uncultured Sporomusa sp.]